MTVTDRKALALATLKDYLGGEGSRPTLSDPELGRLLDRYKVADPSERPPTRDDWEGAWALNAAAAEGWRMKAARVAGDFNFSADDASYSKGDVMAHCLEMEQSYRALSIGYMELREPGPAYTSERLIL